jgi:hypothetical protein
MEDLNTICIVITSVVTLLVVWVILDEHFGGK